MTNSRGNWFGSSKIQLVYWENQIWTLCLLTQNKLLCKRFVCPTVFSFTFSCCCSRDSLCKFHILNMIFITFVYNWYHHSLSRENSMMVQRTALAKTSNKIWTICCWNWLQYQNCIMTTWNYIRTHWKERLIPLIRISAKVNSSNCIAPQRKRHIHRYGLCLSWNYVNHRFFCFSSTLNTK